MISRCFKWTTERIAEGRAARQNGVLA